MQSLQAEEVLMSSAITVRGLDDAVKRRLRIRAAEHDRSMEAEIRAILEEAVAPPPAPEGLGTRLKKLFADVDADGLFDDVRSQEPPRDIDFG
jgi:plasmid stability protein